MMDLKYLSIKQVFFYSQIHVHMHDSIVSTPFPLMTL